MKCPHCNETIGLFSKEMNKFGKIKACPNCKKQIRMFVSLKIVALLFIPTVAIALILHPVFERFGVSGSLATGLMTGLMCMAAMRVREA